MKYGWKPIVLALVAAGSAFFLFFPLLCSGDSFGATSCTTVLGLEMPGFTGRGSRGVSYVAPSVAGVAVFVLVLLMARRTRRRGEFG